MFKIKQSKSFTKEIKKLIKQKKITEDEVIKVIYKLAQDPFDKTLKSHKVDTRILGKQYSSRLDGDLRIIWNFDKQENLTLLLLDLGGHSGNKGVYK